MGLFDKLFNNNDNDSPSIWKTLTSIEELNEIIQNSHQKPAAIFKHSTRCSISSMAKDRLERNWKTDLDTIDLFYLDLIQFRPVSNKIEALLGIQHESPQVIVIKAGQPVFNASHSDITAEGVQGAV